MSYLHLSSYISLVVCFATMYKDFYKSKSAMALKTGFHANTSNLQNEISNSLIIVMLEKCLNFNTNYQFIKI